MAFLEDMRQVSSASLKLLANPAAFVRDAPRLVPGTTMPALPLSERESHDVAAYLYTLE